MPRRGDEGFTRARLIVIIVVACSVVIVLPGIAIAIAIPVYLNYSRSANDKAALSDLRRAIGVLEICNADKGAYPAVDARWTVTTPVCGTGGNGQSVTVTTGTTLTYRATGARAGAAYLLFASSNRGKHASYCYSSAKGGSMQTQTAATTTACP